RPSPPEGTPLRPARRAGPTSALVGPGRRTGPELTPTGPSLPAGGDPSSSRSRSGTYPRLAPGRSRPPDAPAGRDLGRPAPAVLPEPEREGLALPLSCSARAPSLRLCASA